MLFGRKKKPGKNRITTQQHLSARPIRLVEANIVPREDGGGDLKVPLTQSRWTGWIYRMPVGAQKTFQLDSMGLLVWEACDGRTDVKQIISRLSKKYGLSLREAQVSTQAFLQTLTRKRLLGLEIRKPSDKGK